MWTEIVLGGVIVMLIVLIVAVQSATNMKSYAGQPEDVICPKCPATKVVPMKITSAGKIVNTTISPALPPLVNGLSNGQYVRDSDNGGIYYIQNGMLSYVASSEALTKLGFQSYIGNYPTSTITSMAFGPPILM